MEVKGVTAGEQETEVDCPRCGGTGTIEKVHYLGWGDENDKQIVKKRCPTCDGEKKVKVDIEDGTDFLVEIDEEGAE